MIPGTAWYVIRNRTGLLVSCYGKAHPCEDGTEAYGEEEPSIAITADLRPFVTHTGLTVNTALFLIVIITHSSSMKGPRLNFHVERELAHPKTTFFRHFSNYSTPTYVVVVLFVVNQRSKLHTYSVEVPVLHTPLEVAEVRFSMTCSFVEGQGKRGNECTYTGHHVGRFP